MKSGKLFMAEDKDLEEAKRIMARMLSMPAKPHKAESRPGPKRKPQTDAVKDAGKPKPSRKPKAAKGWVARPSASATPRPASISSGHVRLPATGLI
jgi:hypothetical protein